MEQLLFPEPVREGLQGDRAAGEEDFLLTEHIPKLRKNKRHIRQRNCFKMSVSKTIR